MTDFGHVTDYFVSYHYEPPLETQQFTDGEIQGVRINCLGDQKVFYKPHFEAVGTPSTDPIFSNHDISDIAQRIGLPIFTRRCLPDAKWANDEHNRVFIGNNPFNNQDAMFLHLCCDPKADFNFQMRTMGWGWASQKRQNRVGSVLVRQDNKPLLPLHVEALCRYCRFDIRPLLAHSVGEYAPEKPMEKDAVLAMICRATFVIYWYKLLEEKSKEG